MLHRGAAGHTQTILIVDLMGTGLCGIAQRQGIVTVVHQGEGDLHASGDPQQLSILHPCHIVEHHGGGLALVALGQIPTGIVGGLQGHEAVLPEGHSQGPIHEQILAQRLRIGPPGIVLTVDHAGQMILRSRLAEAAVGTNVVLIGVLATDAAHIANAVIPVVSADHTAGDALPFHPAVLTVDGANGANAIDPAMSADHTTDLTQAVPPIMDANDAADGADAVLEAMVAFLTAGTLALHIGMVRGAAANSTDAVGAVVGMGTILCHIGQHVGIVAVIHQREGDDLSGGHEELVLGGDVPGIVQGSGGDLPQIPVSHVPVQVVRGLDAHIAVLGEVHRQLAVRELVRAQILLIVLVGVVRAIDPAEEIVVILRLLPAADGANVVLQAVGHRLAAAGANTVLVVAVMGTGGLIAQDIGIIPVVHQGEGHQLAAGDEELVRVGQDRGVVQSGGGGIALPALGHIPVGIVRSLHRHIAVHLEPDLQLAVHELVLAQVGVVLLAGIVGTVDPAEQIVVILGLGLTANGTDVILIGMDALLAADGAQTVGHLVVTLQTADTEAVGPEAVLHSVTANGAHALGGVAGVTALHSHIGQLIGVIPIVHQGEGDLGAAGDEELVSGTVQLGGVVQGHGGHEALPTIGHVPVHIVGGLHTNIAVFGEEHHHLTVHELVPAQILIVLLAGVVSAIDPTEEVVVILGLRHTAVGTDVVLIAVTADITAQGADAVRTVGMSGVGTVHIAVQGPALHLPGVGGLEDLIGPIGPVRPPLIGVLLLIVGVALSVDIGHEMPVGVGTSGPGCLIAHVAGIALIVAGSCGAVIGVEHLVLAGGVCHRVVGTGIAPVIIQITADRVGIDHSLGGVGLVSGDLAGLVVVLAVQAVGGAEAGRPTVDVLDLPCGSLDPLTAGLGVALQRGVRGDGGLMIGVAVLLLGLDQCLGDPLRLRLGPLGQQMLRILLIAVTAEGAGVTHLLIVHTGGTHGLGGVGMTAIGHRLLIDMAAGGAGEDLPALCHTGGLQHHGLLIAVGTGSLVRGGGDHHEALLQQHRFPGGLDHLAVLHMVGGVTGTDHIGILAQSQVPEQHTVIHRAAIQGVSVVRHLGAGTGGHGPIQPEAGKDLRGNGGQLVPLGAQLAPDEEVSALHQPGGIGRGGQADVVRQILKIHRIRRQDMAHGAGLADHLVPQLAHGVVVDPHHGVPVTVARQLQLDGGGLGGAVAGQGHDGAGSLHQDLTVGMIALTATGIAGLDLRGGRQQRRLGAGIDGGADAGMITVSIPDLHEVRKAQGVVHIPVPHLGDVGPHAVPEAVILSAAVGVVAAVPDLLLGADAGVVAPDQEVGTAQIGLRHIGHVLHIVAMLADIRRIPFVPDILFIGMIEGPLPVPDASGIGAAAGLTQGVIGTGLDAVVDDPSLVHIIAHRLGMVIGRFARRIEGRIPVLDLDIVGELVIGSIVGGASKEIVVHPHGVSHGTQQCVQLIDVVDEIREPPGVLIAGGDVRSIQLHLVGTNAHMVGTGILLEEVGDVDVQLEDEGLGQRPLDVDGRVVGPLQGCGPVLGTRIVDDAVHILGIIGLLVVGGVEGIAVVTVVVLLEGPGQIVQMGGTVEAGDHLDVILRGSTQDLHHLGGGQILALVLVVLIGRQRPGGVVGAADPAKIVLGLELALIIGRIPQVEAEAGVIGEVELQGIVTHPGHLPDEVADPVLGIVLPSAVQTHRTLDRIRRVGGAEAPDGVGPGVAQMLLQHIGTVDQAPHIAGGDSGGGPHLQLIAFRGHAGGRIHPDHDIAIIDPALRPPDDVHGGIGGQLIRMELPPDQLDRLQQLPGGLRIRDHEDAADVAEREGLVVLHIPVHHLAYGRGVRHGEHRHGRKQTDHHDHQQDPCDRTFHIVSHDLIPFPRWGQTPALTH